MKTVTTRNKQMILSSLMMVLLLFIISYFSYLWGAKNQRYYDAPSKILLYEKILSADHDEKGKILKGLIMNQRCILAEETQNVGFMLNHPIHKGLKDMFGLHFSRACQNHRCGCNRLSEE